MKKFILIGFWASAGFLGFACGDSDDGSSGTGGTSGTSTGGSGGATNGGAAGSGTTGGSSGAGVTGGAAGNAGSATGGSAGSGADGGVGAEGGMGEGGMGEGGETTTGGSAGSGGGGMSGTAGGGNGGGGTGGAGAGGGPNMACPMNQPMPMTMCPTRGLSCDFGDTICRCNLNTGNWNCFDQNGNCPAMPNPGGTCTGGQTACSYGTDGTCVCIQGDFTCDDGVVSCPTARPTDGASCTMFPAGFDCTYPAGDCSCGTGVARTWNCEGGGGTCPAMAPDTGDACMTPGLICEFNTPGPGADETCVCDQNNDWNCL
jgi:hypothetical protein